VKITDGISRLGSGMINSYLLEENGEVTIIDAGVPGYWDDLPAELAAMGLSIEHVRALLLTHGHTDHIGFAERLRTESGVRVSVHELDAALARGEIPNPAKTAGRMRPRPMLSFFWFAARGGLLRVKHVGEVSTFGDGATLDVPGAPRVILVPGHTAGSAALHAPARDALFIGDAIATYSVIGGESGPMLNPFNADRATALASLSRLDDIQARNVLAGHGQAWTEGVQAALARVRTRAAAEAALQAKPG
jgi:glyoxylase-like metal-dependent hydrolase (beta-lactamase superfamily II)